MKKFWLQRHPLVKEAPSSQMMQVLLHLCQLDPSGHILKVEVGNLVLHLKAQHFLGHTDAKWNRKYICMFIYNKRLYLQKEPIHL